MPIVGPDTPSRCEKTGGTKPKRGRMSMVTNAFALVQARKSSYELTVGGIKKFPIGVFGSDTMKRRRFYGGIFLRMGCYDVIYSGRFAPVSLGVVFYCVN